MKKRLNKKGFTLIELIVVIAILAILALILIPSISGYIQKANVAKDQANARSLYTQEAMNAASNPAYATASVTGGGQTCTITVASGVITEFSCTGGTSGKTFALSTNFAAN